MLNGLDLFTGIGGISYALSDYVRPVAYCEIDPYCQSVLLSRMQEGDLPKAPIWDDIRTFPCGHPIKIDIIYGGFPCQDISCAGTGKGLEGERSGLFFEILRLAKEIKPTFLFLENVPAITGRGGLQVIREITALGYDCRWCVISAAQVGAVHRRERWFLLAHSKHNGTSSSQTRESVRKIIVQREQHEQEKGFRPLKRTGSIPSNVANNKNENDSNSDSITGRKADSQAKPINDRGEAWREHSRLYRPFKSRAHWQKVVGSICRVDDGIPHRVDRLKALGNSVVPQQVRKAWEILFTGRS